MNIKINVYTTASDTSLPLFLFHCKSEITLLYAFNDLMINFPADVGLGALRYCEYFT